MILAKDAYNTPPQWRESLMVEYASRIADALERLADSNEKILRKLERDE